MLIDSFAIIAGFILLIWSADRFIVGAASVARNFDVPPLIIGLTIVGFGTSAPEMMVAGFAAYNGSPAMAIGNALGSNITNITLVLGVAAIITPLEVQSRIIKKELPILLIATLVAIALMSDLTLSRFDGFVLFGLLCLLMWWIARQGIRNQSSDALTDEFIEELPAEMPTSKSVDESLLKEFDFVRDVIMGIRKVRKEKNIANKDEISLLIKKNEGEEPLTAFDPVVSKLCKLSSLDYTDQKEEGAVSFIIRSTEFYVPLEGSVDIEAEIEKLESELKYAKGFLLSVDKKLSNERFVNNAPDQVVEKEKQKKADAEAKIRVIEEQLKALRQ